MKLATLACLSALCLTAPLAAAAPGEPTAAEPLRKEPTSAAAKPLVAKPEAAARESATKEGTTKAETAAARAERPATAPAAGGRDRRRRSYAACNRASHQRGYRGGKRRRFLIRCRLGYERTRLPPHQAPAAPSPAPVRKTRDGAPAPTGQ